MILYVTAFCVFAIVIVLMAIGVILGGRRIQGSCGGLSTWTDELGRPMCDACAECPEKKRECELEAGGGESAEPASVRSPGHAASCERRSASMASETLGRVDGDRRPDPGCRVARDGAEESSRRGAR